MNRNKNLVVLMPVAFLMKLKKFLYPEKNLTRLVTVLKTPNSSFHTGTSKVEGPDGITHLRENGTSSTIEEEDTEMRRDTDEAEAEAAAETGGTKRTERYTEQDTKARKGKITTDGTVVMAVVLKEVQWKRKTTESV